MEVLLSRALVRQLQRPPLRGDSAKRVLSVARRLTAVDDPSAAMSSFDSVHGLVKTRVTGGLRLVAVHLDPPLGTTVVFLAVLDWDTNYQRLLGPRGSQFADELRGRARDAVALDAR